MLQSKEVLFSWVEDTLDGLDIKATEDQTRYLTDEIYKLMEEEDEYWEEDGEDEEELDVEEEPA